MLVKNFCESHHTHAQAGKPMCSLWDGAQLLGVDFKASSADEMNKAVAELQKVSKNVVAHMRKVEQN